MIRTILWLSFLTLVFVLGIITTLLREPTPLPASVVPVNALVANELQEWRHEFQEALEQRARACFECGIRWQELKGNAPAIIACGQACYLDQTL